MGQGSQMQQLCKMRFVNILKTKVIEAINWIDNGYDKGGWVPC